MILCCVFYYNLMLNKLLSKRIKLNNKINKLNKYYMKTMK